MRFARLSGTLVVALALVSGCKDDPVSPLDPTLTLTVNPATLTINPASTDETTITVVREDSPEEVELALTGGAEGVTGTILNIDVDGNTTTATLRIVVLGDVAPGNYTFMVIASNDDADDATRIVTVTVPPQGGGGDVRD